jgi:hypothetical protein
MRPVLAILLAALVAAAAATAALDARRVRVVAWARSATKSAVAPPDAVSSGVYCTDRAIRRLYAFIRFSGMRDKLPSTATWYFNGDRVFVFRFKWEDGDAGRTAFSLHRTKGALVEGAYKIEVRSAGQLLARASVKLEFGSC